METRPSASCPWPGLEACGSTCRTAEWSAWMPLCTARRHVPPMAPAHADMPLNGMLNAEWNTAECR